MKARVLNNTEKSNKIVLSIGMIVKNEEKHLENCLSALKNLTDYISSELIIVDTGSTDRTKEIALKYTDKVYDFEWIDDFAAARNYGLKKAKGKWFMFLDADEYFDKDCSQLIEFFSYPEFYEYGKWHSATLSMRNYVCMNKDDYSLSSPLRLARITSELVFEGKIHERLEKIHSPIAGFETIVHHYGYVLDNSTFKNKSNRNMPILLEELKNNPKNARIVGQIIDSCIDKKEKKQYVDMVLKLIELPENKRTINENLHRAIIFYNSIDDNEKTIEIINKYFSYNGNEKSITALDAYYIQALAYLNRNDFEKSADAYEKFIETYKLNQNGKLEIFDSASIPIFFSDRYAYVTARFNYIASLCKLQEFEKAQKVLKEFNISELSNAEYKNWIKRYFIVFEQLKDYSQAIEIYQKALATKDKDKIKLAVQIFENFYSSHLLDREDFVNAIAESDAEGLYIDLMKIVKADNDGKDVTSVLTDFIHRVDDWKYGYAEAIYLCMKHNIDINDILVTLSNSIMKSHFPIIATTHEEYAQTVIDYCKSFDYTQSIHAMLWMTSALETAVLSSANLYEEQRAVLYDTFVCVLSDYIYNIYNQELLNVDDVDVLPELHRFGFYMTLAFTAQNDGDDIGYIRCLREALRLCEPMKDLVSFYLDKFAEKMKE